MCQEKLGNLIYYKNGKYIYKTRFFAKKIIAVFAVTFQFMIKQIRSTIYIVAKEDPIFQNLKEKRVICMLYVFC